MDTDQLKRDLLGRQARLEEHEIDGVGVGWVSTDGQPKFHAHEFIEKSETGFVGLSNQGATCYLNSLVQSLYMSPELRDAVYEWEYADKYGDKAACVPYQLQKLFADMQISDRGQMKTEGLTKSFGWTQRQVYIQHDVVELMNVLFDFLERNNKDTCLGKVINSKYRGTMTDYVQCKTCNTFRGRQDSYISMALPIEHLPSLEAALKQYIKPEVLEGDNAYRCSVCDSKQPALKGIRFETFPYFLNIQLGRFTMNWQTFARMKLNHDVTFPKTLDAKDYLHQEEGKDNGEATSKYELYSMLIHTGSATGGHYFAYIKDLSDEKWYKFDDSRVVELKQEDIEKAFQPREVAAAGVPAAGVPPPAGVPLPAGVPAPPVPGALPVPPASGAPPPMAPGAPAPPPLNSNPPPLNSVPPTLNSAPPPLNAAAAPPPLNAAAAPPLSAEADTKPVKKWRTVQAETTALQPGDTTGTASTSTRGPAVHMFVDPVSHAYMLMYRRVDTDKNVNAFDSAKIQSYLVELIKKENEEYKVKKAEYDRQRNILAIGLHYDGEKHQLEVKKNESLRAATQFVLDELHLGDKGLSIDSVRLRYYDVVKNLPGGTFEGKDNVNVGELNIKDKKDLLLEVRQPEEEWEPYDPNKMFVRVAELDDATLEYKEPVLVSVSQSVRDLRQICSQKLQTEPSCVRMVFLTDEHWEILVDEQELKRDCKIYEGDIVQVERCDDHLSGESKIVKKFVDALNKLTINFNIPGIFEPDHQVTTDARKTLADLKELLSQQLDIPAGRIKARKNIHDKEFKDLKKTLQFYGLTDGCIVYLEEGEPLLPNEYLFQIFVEIAKEGKEDDRFLLVGEIVVDETWSLKRLKEEIAKLPQTPDANHQRIREALRERLTRVYLDDRDVKANVQGMIDYKQIVVQKTAKQEHLTKDSLLIIVLQWFSDEFRLGKPNEIALDKNMTIPELATYFSEDSKISEENISFVQPWSYQLKNLEEIPGLDWDGIKLHPNATISSKPWTCRSGDYLLFKDRTKKERKIAVGEEKGEDYKPVRQLEEGIHIYSPEEQEKMKKIQEENDRQLNEEAKKNREDAMKRRDDALKEIQSGNVQGIQNYKKVADGK